MTTTPLAPAPVLRSAVAVVAVQGPLEVGTVPRVREQLAEALAARPARLVVDLADCPFVDACALTMLLDLHRRCCRAAGCSPCAAARAGAAVAVADRPAPGLRPVGLSGAQRARGCLRVRGSSTPSGGPGSGRSAPPRALSDGTTNL
jgi:ABC-type transporter Mla MlaB component